MTLEFFITSLIVVLIPGTGVIYTISTGLFRGSPFAVSAAIGCTFGIVPHILASALGLAALLHTSAVAFQVVKYAGVAYLLYLAYTMWKETGQLSINKDDNTHTKGHLQTALSGILINILNPKLSIFFLAFLPQFINPAAHSPTFKMIELGIYFMGMTLAVFLIYGFAAAWMRHHVIENPRVTQWLQRGFAGMFALLGLKLALEER